MRKFLASALAGVTAAGAVAATATPAAADSYRYRHDRHHHGDKGDVAAAAVVAGIAGLAIGAALSGGDHDRRDRDGYSSGYYRGYSYDPRYDSYGRGYDYGRSYDYGRRSYRVCTTHERVWDPYIGRHVTVERRYAC